jgi:G3E family GTPase
MIPVTLLCGFLGSGKTTLLRRLLREAPSAARLGVIVNDVSDLEVDGDLLRESERLSEAEGTLVSLFSGSISGEKREAFRDSLARFANRTDLSHIIIETSGSSHPLPLIQEVQALPNLQLKALVTLLDTQTLVTDHGSGIGLLRQLVANEKLGRRSTENLLVEQLQCASHIVLTKAERVPEPELALVRKTLEVLQPKATVLTARYGQTDCDLLQASGFDAQQAERLAATLEHTPIGESHHYDIGNSLIRDPRPLHPQRFWDHFHHHLGTGIHRSKGFIWLASRPEQVLLWNQSGGSLGLELLAYWKAALVHDPDGRLLPEEIALLQQQLHGTDPVFGDRLNELTVIGTAQDRGLFICGLQACFCTEPEIRHWQAGGTFTDPWPNSLRRV